MSILRLAARFAARQHGLVTSKQLLGAGAPRKTVEAAVRRGDLIRVEVGVYRLLGVPTSGDQTLRAQLLAAHPQAVFSHRSALWLWGCGEAPRRHELSVPRGVRHRRPNLVAHESTDLDLVIRGDVRGLPVTDVGRTVLDCARDPAVDLELLIEEVRRVMKPSPTLLPWVVVTHARRGRPGITRLRRHLTRNPLADSEFERLVARWFGLHGLSGWVLHHRVELFGWLAVVDFAWPDLKIAVELDGATHWERVDKYRNDMPRQNRLELDEWLVIRFTYERWLQDPEGILWEIRTAIARRAA